MNPSELRVGEYIMFANRGPYKVLRVAGNMATFRDERGVSTDAPISMLSPYSPTGAESTASMWDIIQRMRGTQPQPSAGYAPAPSYVPPTGGYEAPAIEEERYPVAKRKLTKIIILAAVASIGFAWWYARKK